MEVMGYIKLQTGSPPEEMITEVERSLRSRPNVVSGPVTYGRSKNYLKFGIQELVEPRIRTRKRNMEIFQFAIERGTVRARRVKMEIMLPAEAFIVWQGFSEDPWPDLLYSQWGYY